MRLGRCPCGVLLCHACKTIVSADEFSTHMCKQGGEATDSATDALITTVCKACPGCGNFLQKADDGCALMMCGSERNRIRTRTF